MNKSKKLSEIKKNHYNFQREDAIKQFGLDLKFKNQPYTYLRWRFNMEISTYLIYLFLRTPLSANFISLIYIILSPLGFFLVISGSIVFADIHPESISTSANIGLAPNKAPLDVVAMKVLGVVINSSPSPRPKERYAADKATVPLDRAIALLVPT